MFGRQSKESQSEVKLEDLVVPPTAEPAEPVIIETTEKSELVITVEKISRVVTPYFIVIVGLVLNDSNGLIGSLLILIGIFSLLKISLKDIAVLFEWIKEFFGLDK
jgi:hypothetical protein